jgi:hypothetical protein
LRSFSGQRSDGLSRPFKRVSARTEHPEAQIAALQEHADEVRDAAGHANVSITAGYLHLAVDDEAGAGKLFPI